MTIEQAYALIGKHTMRQGKRAEIVAIIHDPDGREIYADLRYQDKTSERVSIERLDKVTK